jgi:predicted acetyltransferase
MIEIRPATESEMGQIGLLTSYVYGGAFGDGEDNFTTQNNRPEWTLCAFEGPKLVASYGAIPFTMRANGRAMAMAGVTIVGTLPEYRRQGLLRRIVEQSFVDMKNRGQTVAALWASQAAIYQRYGYSLCAVQRRYEVDTVDINLLVEPGAGYEVRREAAADAMPILKALYRSFIAERTLYLHRSTPLWQGGVLADREGEGPTHIAICRDGSGNAVGYLVYTLRDSKVDHPARGQEIQIRDLVWLDIAACRALWAFVGRHDLVGRVVWPNAPADDPAWEIFAEPRLLNAQDKEGVYFRIVDVAGALGERGYSADGEIVIGVGPDRESPWNQGNWQLAVANGEAEVRATTDPAEVQFSIKSLSSAFSGFRRVSQLAAWGLVEGDAGAIARADAIFATPHAPHSPDHF